VVLKGEKEKEEHVTTQNDPPFKRQTNQVGKFAVSDELRELALTLIKIESITFMVKALCSLQALTDSE
jgi:hypothetical protein